MNSKIQRKRRVTIKKPWCNVAVIFLNVHACSELKDLMKIMKRTESFSTTAISDIYLHQFQFTFSFIRYAKWIFLEIFLYVLFYFSLPISGFSNFSTLVSTFHTNRHYLIFRRQSKCHVICSISKSLYPCTFY